MTRSSTEPGKLNPRDEYLLKEFGVDLQVKRNLSLNTVKTYLNQIRKLLVKTKKTIETLQQDDVNQYYLYLMNIPLDRNHLAVANLALRTFWQWYSEKYNASNLAAHLTPPRRKVIDPYVPPVEHIWLAVNHCVRRAERARTEKGKFVNLENAAIICFLLDTGLRVSEMVALNLSDITVHQDFFHLRVYSPKTRRVREFDFGELSQQSMVGEVFALYWQYRCTKFEHNLSDPLFPSVCDFPNLEHRLGSEHVWRRLEVISRHIGRVTNKANSIHPHSLRHFNATYQYLNGMSLRTIQYRLGHAMISTTERYIHVAEQRRGTIGSQLAGAGLRAPIGITGFAKIIKSSYGK
jgi:site-specific recombinase XerD